MAKSLSFTTYAHDHALLNKPTSMHDNSRINFVIKRYSSSLEKDP